MNVNELFIIYGDSPKEMVKQILNEIQIENEISKQSLIGIKPNLVVAKPANLGATTSPDLVEGVLEYILEHNFNNIVILEGSWIGENTSQAFKVCGYEKLSKQYHIPLFDLQQDSYIEYNYQGFNVNICQKVMEIDYLINIPVLKGHCQTKLTCALKNLKGCIPDFEKRRFHTLGLHQPIAFLNRLIRQNLVIVDGLMGDLDFEEGGNPVPMNRIIVGKDPVLIDSYAAEIMGYKISEIPYINISEQLSVGSSDLINTNIKEINKVDFNKPAILSPKVKQLTQYIEEDGACSACYGSLIHAMARLNSQGKLRKLNSKIHIGQGFKGKQSSGIGFGNCCANFTDKILGCPPKAIDLVDFF